ncbi:hypothetical protein PTKIN_Ptkin01aG0049200 [Pterospermum kingtungense]
MCELKERQATEGKSNGGSKIQDNNDGQEESAALQLEGDVSLGELIWVKLRGNSWWPAQVVDENSVSESSKPGKRSQGEVLVRLYGSYDFLYADPMKYYSEFKTILEQHNGSCYEILDKALEQHCSRRKSIKRKGGGSTSTDNARRKNPRRNGSRIEDKAGSKTSKQDENQKKVKINSPSSDRKKNGTPKQNKLSKEKSSSQSFDQNSSGKSPKSSARRMRVMQGLGLVAPPGSPFLKNRLI